MKKVKSVTENEKIEIAYLICRLNLMELVTLRNILNDLIDDRYRNMPKPYKN